MARPASSCKETRAILILRFLTFVVRGRSATTELRKGGTGSFKKVGGEAGGLHRPRPFRQRGAFSTGRRERVATHPQQGPLAGATRATGIFHLARSESPTLSRRAPRRSATIRRSSRASGRCSCCRCARH